MKRYAYGVAGLLLAALAIAPATAAHAATPQLDRAQCARLYDRLTHGPSPAQHDRILIRGALADCFVLD